MHKIENKAADTRERVRILSQKDLDFSYFCGSGAGGQAKNKVHSGCQIMHKESGAIGRASDSRSLDENKKSAFKRLLATPQMKFWLAKKIFEINQRETLEESVAKSLNDKNLKYEIKDTSGRWIQVNGGYFNSTESKVENIP